MRKQLFVLCTIGCALLWAGLGCETGELLEGDDEFQDRASSIKEYQAESATGKSGCSVASNRAGYTGSGFMDFGSNGTWMEWNNVNAVSAGDHTLTFRFAVASGSRQCALLINGVNVGNLPFSSTGAWTTWKTVSITKALKAGNNTIRVLANTSSGGPNLDKMDLSFSGVVPSGTCALVNENSTASLSCPSGQTIKGISFASYGTPTGSCPSFATSACHASTSKSKVEAACLNKSSCSVGASNALFGDPCGGTFKKLAIVYSCGSSSGVQDLCPSDPHKTEPGKCGCGIPEGTCDSVVGGPLDKASGTKLRIASWNNFRGSIFPKTNTVWKAINTSGKYHVSRTEGAARILDAVEADIWMMQETVYSTSALPSGVTKDSINNQIASYMQSVTGDSWKVSCNAEGLCTMVRNNLKFDGHWEKGGRVTGDRIILPDGSRVLVVNVHYMNSDHATDTKNLIDSLASTVSAVFVAGDFNDGSGGPRYNIVDGISGMNNLSMVHFKDPSATHLTSSMQKGAHKNTKGYMKWGEGPSGQDFVTSIGGGQIDHFFLKSNNWKAGNRFILNTLLFSQRTLNLYGLRPLDVALQPQYYTQYFRDFLSKGIIYEIPSSAYDHSSGLDHDHLPMIIDFSW
jgi:hypothetical protein